MCSFLRASASLVALSLLNHFTATEESITISISDHGPAIFGSLLIRSSRGSSRTLEACLWILRLRASVFFVWFPRRLVGNLAPVDVWDVFHLLLQFLGDRNCHVGHFHPTQEWLCVMYKCFLTV